MNNNSDGAALAGPRNPKRVGLATRAALYLFRTFPPSETIFKESPARARIEYDDEVARPTPAMFGRDAAWLAGKDVVDLGSGFGGRTVRYAEQGARSAVGIEVSQDQVHHSTVFAGERASPARFLVGAGEAIPLPDGSADIIVMNDVMEHVVDPARVLAECRRVLRPGGELAVTFPPYYALHGGSHLHGYASWLPGLNLVFPTRTLKAAARIRLAEQGIDMRRYFREIPSDKLWNQNGLTVRRWNRLVAASGFHVVHRANVGFFCRRLKRKTGIWRLAYPAAYCFLTAFAVVPIVREAGCPRIVEILSRP